MMADALERAAAQLEAAANKMKEAAREIDFALSNNQRFMDNWLERFETVLEQVMPEEGTVFAVKLVRDDEEEESRPTERPPAVTT
jgi:hypothetical protein